MRGACELLGLDPLYVANEGKLVALVAPEAAQAALAAFRDHEFGSEAAIIGRVTEDHPGRVVLRTALGARRFWYVGRRTIAPNLLTGGRDSAPEQSQEPESVASPRKDGRVNPF